ncbi:MAG: phosphatidylserine decarboxylase [Oscillospiraceae bacterium]|nr:phosphatidylserine decarboxylase [Oscillospiraceae bacterium]
MQEMPKFETVDIDYEDSGVIKFLYRTILGRVLLSLLTQRAVSLFMGMIMNSIASCMLIPGFIKRNHIDMSAYETKKYRSFNEFFERKIKMEERPFQGDDHEVAAPCDGKLSAYKITPDSVFYVKQAQYALSELLQDAALAKAYTDGICLIFRLEPTDYHRYAFIDDGEIVMYKKIDGILHTVRPISHCTHNVFAQNAREYVGIQTKHLGKIIQMEVGALFVGKINNYKYAGSVSRAEEKGLFRFGGSTVIMLFPKGSIDVHTQILENTKNDKETLVKMGNSIGRKLS